MTMTRSHAMAATQAATSTKSKVESGASTATNLSPRARIGRQILIYHFILIGIASVYYLLRGFDFEEFTALMGILAPVTAMYGGAVFRFIGRSITEPNLNGNSNQPVNNMVKWLVHGHFVTVMALISLKALAPNILNFQDMIMFLTLVESALGVYMGNIILALFEPQAKKE